MPGGQVVRDRERVLRQDVQPRPGLRAEHLRRGREADHVPGERVPGRRRGGELLRGELHAERSRGVRDGRPGAVPRRDGGRHRRLPPDPEPEREHHPRGRQARTRSRRPRTSCSARRPAPRPVAHQRRASSCAFPARTRSSRSPTVIQGNRILELLATHPIETYLLNTGRVGGEGGRRALEEGEDPAHVGVRRRRSPSRRSRGRGTTTSATWSRTWSRGSTTPSCSSRGGSTSARAGWRSTARSSSG